MYFLTARSTSRGGRRSGIGSTLVDTRLNSHEDITMHAAGRSRDKLEKRFAAYRGNEYRKLLKGDIAWDDILVDTPVEYIVHAASPAHPLA